MKNISGITLYAITVANKMDKAERTYQRLQEELNGIVVDIPQAEMGYYVRATTHK